jgi:hypothetical protein
MRIKAQYMSLGLFGLVLTQMYKEMDGYVKKKSKVKQSHYTPWRRLGGEEV